VDELEGPELEMIQENVAWVGQHVVAPKLLSGTALRFRESQAGAYMEFPMLNGVDVAESAKKGVKLAPHSLKIGPSFSSGVALFSYGDAVS
jgi:hypothetical protein